MEYQNVWWFRYGKMNNDLNINIYRYTQINCELRQNCINLLTPHSTKSAISNPLCFLYIFFFICNCNSIKSIKLSKPINQK